MSKCVEKGGCLWHCMQIVRWFPVAIVAAAVGWGYYAFVFQLCFNAVQNLWQRILYLIVFHILLVLFLLSYYRTIFARLRTPAKEFYLEEEDLSEIHAAYSAGDFPKAQAILRRIASIRRIPVQTRGYDGGIRMCDKCKCIKPDRAHHCSVCGQCVLKFDHHCPWVNNCVNFHNYKFFLLFLGYAFAFCMFVFFVDLPYFIEFWKSDFRGTNGGKFHLLFLEFVSGMFAISVSCLFFYHLYLVSKNRSTIESFTAPTLVDGTKDKNAFNHGVRANFREVFGPSIWKGILPIYTSCGDGMEFTVRDGAMCLGVTVAGHQGYGNHTTTTTRSDSGPYDSASVGDRTTNTRTGSSNSYHGSASNGYSTHTAGTGYGNGRPTGQHQQQHRFHPEVAPLNQYGPALQQQQRVYRYHNGKGNEALEMV